MSDIHAIAYLSRINVNFSETDLAQLLQSARQYNHQLGVSGVLLHNTGFFFQYVEGSHTSVSQVYQRIKNDKRHTITLEVFNAPTEKKYFEQWLMAFCTPPDNFIQDLSQQSWIQKATELKPFEHDSLGLKMLIKFWNNFSTQNTAIST